jgi:hypothetical protein
LGNRRIFPAPIVFGLIQSAEKMTTAKRELFFEEKTTYNINKPTKPKLRESEKERRGGKVCRNGPCVFCYCLPSILPSAYLDLDQLLRQSGGQSKIRLL